MKRQKVCSTLITSAFMLYAIISGIIAAVILFSKEEYMCKTTFLVPNFVLLGFGILMVFGALFLTRLKSSFKCRGNINIASLILFCVQGFVFYNILFTTKWDVDIVLRNAQMIAEGQVAELDHYYFSNYPYNQLIVFLFAVFYKANDLIGIFGDQEAVFFIVLVQCALSTLAGRMLFQIVKDSAESEAFAWFGWGIYVILIGLSGWNIIPYTDMMGLIFPIVILRIYQTLETGKREFWKWFGISILSFWGYKIKAHVIVVVIALGIVEGLHLIKAFKKDNLKKAILVLAICLMSVLISFRVEIAILEQTGFDIDEEASLGMTHMVMLGLNEKSNGVHYEPDVEFSQMFLLKETRNKEEVKVIKQRLADYGPIGVLKHLHKKTLTNFNDGTFAWGHEGNFFNHIFDDRNQIISPFLKNVYYTYGAYYGISSTVRQMLWLVVFTVSLGAFGLKKDKVNSVLIISLLGIIFLVTIFEARARYLISYVPFWIITSCLVLYRLRELIEYSAEKFSENLDFPPEM